MRESTRRAIARNVAKRDAEAAITRVAQQSMTALEDGVLDQHWSVVTDSTGANTGGQTDFADKWEYLLAEQLAARYPNLNIRLLLWDDTSSSLPSKFTGTTHATITVDGIDPRAVDVLQVGMPIAGTGIPNGATIASIASATSITLSAAASGSATVTLTAGVAANVFDVATGRSGPHLFIWVYGKAGISFNYLNAPLKRALGITAVAPDVVFVNLGKNESSQTGNSRQTRLLTLTEAVKRDVPDAEIVLIVQNPTIEPALTDNTAANIAEIRQVFYRVARFKGYDIVDIYRAFEETGDVASLTNADGVHPTYGAGDTGSQVWADRMARALTYQPGQAPKPQVDSAFLKTVPSIIPNGDFQDWPVGATAPTGWTLSANAAAAMNTVAVERPGIVSVDLTPISVGGGVVWMFRSMSAAELALVKGKTITVRGRVKVAAGQAWGTGMIRISDGITTFDSHTSSSMSQLYDGTYMDIVATAKISQRATLCNIILFADRGTGAAGAQATWQSVWVGLGQEPKSLLSVHHAVATDTTIVPHIVREMAGQTSNARQVMSPTGDVLEGVNATGEHLANTGRRVAVRNVTTATFTVGLSRDYVGCNPASNAIALTLPDPTTCNGKLLTIKDETGNAATNNITLATTNAKNIDGATSYVISTNFGFVQLISNGTRWQIISS